MSNVKTLALHIESVYLDFFNIQKHFQNFIFCHRYLSHYLDRLLTIQSRQKFSMYFKDTCLLMTPQQTAMNQKVFRNVQDNREDQVMLLVCGLHNFRMNHRLNY